MAISSVRGRSLRPRTRADRFLVAWIGSRRTSRRISHVLKVIMRGACGLPAETIGPVLQAVRRQSRAPRLTDLVDALQAKLASGETRESVFRQMIEKANLEQEQSGGKK